MFSTLATLGGPAQHAGAVAGFGWWFLLIPLFWILVLVAIAAIAGRRWHRAGWAHGYGHYGHPGHWGPSAARSAEASLAERFAQGDIDEKEYRARLEVLRANAFPAAPSTSK